MDPSGWVNNILICSPFNLGHWKFNLNPSWSSNFRPCPFSWSSLIYMKFRLSFDQADQDIQRLDLSYIYMDLDHKLMRQLGSSSKSNSIKLSRSLGWFECVRRRPKWNCLMNQNGKNVRNCVAKWMPPLEEDPGDYVAAQAFAYLNAYDRFYVFK